MLPRRLLLAGGGGSFVIPPSASVLTDPSSVGWTVPQDPKAVYANGKTFFGWVGSDGDAYIASYDHASRTVSTPFALHGSGLGGSQGNPDPHDSPAILVRSDGHILVAYSAHEGSTCYLRISTNAYDVTAFGAEASLDASLGGTAYTYMGLAELTGEGKVYLFYRDRVSTTGHIAYSTSSDGGATWAAQTRLFTPNTGQRAYRRMGSNGVDRIDIITTHKDPDTNIATAAAIFHLYYDAADGAWHASDGTTLTLPADKLTATLVLGVTTGTNWSAGITYAGGNPISLTLIQKATTIDVHQARWNGSAWSDLTVEDALDGVYSNAYHPATMAHDDPDLVWVSKKVGSHWEMHRYTSADNGATWTGTALTSGSTLEHTQPDSVWNADAALRVVWLYGDGGTAPDFNDGDFAIWGGT